MEPETDREAAAAKEGNDWHGLPDELKHEVVLFGSAGSDEAWHQNKFISLVLQVSKQFGKILDSGYFHRLRAKLDGSRLISATVISEIYGNKTFSSNDPRSAEIAGHRSIIEELDILLPVLDASSPKVREDMFSSVNHAGALQRMAGYSKMVERPALFKIEGERLTKVIDDAIAQLDNPADWHPDTRHYAAVVLMKKFSELSPEQHFAIESLMIENRYALLNIADAIVEHAPSLITDNILSLNIVHCLKNMDSEQRSRTLVALANEAASLYEHHKTYVAQLSLEILEDNEETNRHRNMAASALAKTYDALNYETRTYVENMKNGDDDAGQMLRSAFNRNTVVPGEIAVERLTTVGEINTETVKDMTAILASSNQSNGYLAARAMSKVTRERERRMHPARAALMQSNTFAAREGL